MADAEEYPSNPASVGPYACRLALKLAEDTVGPVCTKVVACLINHGAQQFADLQRTSDLQPSLLKNALLVLLQQNYVACYLKQEPPTLRGPGPKYSLYEVVLPRILQVLRLPRFLTHIADEHGSEAEKMVRNLLEHGRLRWDQLLNAASSDLAAAQEEGEEGLHDGGSAPPDPAVLLNQFRSLVLQHYIERAPPCNLPPPPQQVHPMARKKKAAPKPGSEEEAELQREQGEAAAWLEYQRVRFLLPEDTGGASCSDVERATAAKPAGKRKRGKDAGASLEEPGKKRGRKRAGAAEVAAEPGEAEGQAATEGAPVLWRVNYDEFNRRFRNELLVETVRLQHSPEHAQAVEGLLLANARFEQTGRTHKTVVLSVGDISSALRRVHGNQGVPSNLDQLLSELVEDTHDFMDAQGSGPQGEQYQLHINTLLDVARHHRLLAVIRNKFGAHAMRVWRLLLAQGQLEQKAVADLAMLTKEEAREALYAMLKAGYLALQDVPRTADHAPSRTFYTWRANLQGALARLSADLYRAAANLHKRLCTELVRQKELLDIVMRPVVPETTVERRAVEIDRLRVVLMRLECALLALDEQIAQFCDF